MQHKETIDRRTKGQGSRRHRGERGQNLVEMALVAPILILIVAIVIDASRVFDAFIVLTQAVREGARLGTVQPELTQGEIRQTVVDDVLGSGTNITWMEEMTTTNVTVTTVETEVAAEVTVEAWYDFDLWFGGLLGVPEIRISREAVMPKYYSGPVP
jgi:Flp pilus assembly protein TadG